MKKKKASGISFDNYPQSFSINSIKYYFISSIAACAAAKIRYFSMSYIILLNNIRLFNFFVSVYYD